MCGWDDGYDDDDNEGERRESCAFFAVPAVVCRRTEFQLTSFCQSKLVRYMCRFELASVNYSIIFLGLLFCV